MGFTNNIRHLLTSNNIDLVQARKIYYQTDQKISLTDTPVSNDNPNKDSQGIKCVSNKIL